VFYRVHTGSGAHPASCLMVPGVKRPGRVADRSPSSTAEVKNAWSYTSTPQYVFISWFLVKPRDKLHSFMVWYLIKHRENFNFAYEGVTKSFRTESITK